MRAEHLKIWLTAAREEENPDPSRWWVVVDKIQMAFFTGELETECTWYTVVFIPKGNREYRIIGLVEVLCKVIDINIYQRLEDSIDLRDVLYGFRSQRGTGTNTLESKPLQNIVGVRK